MFCREVLQNSKFNCPVSSFFLLFFFFSFFLFLVFVFCKGVKNNVILEAAASPAPPRPPTKLTMLNAHKTCFLHVKDPSAHSSPHVLLLCLFVFWLLFFPFC